MIIVALAAQVQELTAQLAAVEQDRDKARGLIALTMAPDAGNAFWNALMYAAARIPQDQAQCTGGETTYADWLRWGASRLDAAIRAAEHSGTEAVGFPHAACRETGEHQPHAWGDPAHWCQGSGTEADR